VTNQRFSSFSIPPCKLLLKSAVCEHKKPAAAFAGAGDTRFSGIYKAPASSQIGATEL
jgi:hypothetical protein